MKLTIRTKLLLGYIIILILLVGMTLFMANKISESNRRLKTIVDVSSKKVNLSNELMIGMLEAGRHEKNIILEKDPVQKDYYKERINRATEKIDANIIELDDLVDDQGRLILNEFKQTWETFKPDLNQIILLALKNEDEAAFKLSIEKGLKTRDVAITQLQRLIDKNLKSMQEEKLENERNYRSSITLILVLITLSIVISLLISYWIVRSITKRISGISANAERIASREFSGEILENTVSDELDPVHHALVNINESFREVTENANKVASGDYSADLVPRSEKDTLGTSLKKMTVSLRETTEANKKHNWLTTGQNQLNEKLLGDQGIQELCENTIAFMANYLNASIGAVYVLREDEQELVLSAQYAFTNPELTPSKFKLNEGLIGQAAKEQKQISITDIREEHIRVNSSVMNAKPDHLLITPFIFEGKTLGVIELGKLSSFTETEKEFIGNAIETVAVSVNSAIARQKIRQLLEETQVQSEELQSQQEELRQINEELEEQSQNLRQQQEELQMTNEELEEQTQMLEMKNREVEAARQDIEQKSMQLELSSKYKSEFLANMSHELRTPLNSLLILSKDLAENKKKNLNDDQVESAEIIYRSGEDLLLLINEVLDLSKIEAGKMTVNVERVPIRKLVDDLLLDFKAPAIQKGLKLNTSFGKDLPESLRTDPQRLNQILKNLMSNAIKFTSKGSVTVEIQRHDAENLAISVIDTGIGIPAEKQRIIFEAFQQADGGTSRKYGGTGLGLSISRELAKLLHSQISLKSQPNEGSTFTIIIPLEIQQEGNAFKRTPVREPVLVHSHSQKDSPYLNYPALEDDRDNLQENDKLVLIIEDDLKFAAILKQQANQKGFKCLSAATGEDGLILAAKYKPAAIILDMDLPGINGNQVLAELKGNPLVRHIPVHIISVNERTIKPIKEGAVEYLMKPVDKKELDNAFSRIQDFINRKMKNLLIIEDDNDARKAMCKLIGNGDVKCFEADSASQALAMYGENHFDCIVMDLGLPDMNGFELIYQMESMKDKTIPPIIIYTGRDLSKEENDELQKYAESIIIKGVKSEERLLDETALFLHRTISKLPDSKRNIIHSLYDKEAIFANKKVLLVDDDMRNVFALSKILKERGMEVVKADNGLNALEMINQHPDIQMVLMDIMMPEMDGYEAMREIRKNPKHRGLPIIALTAKAMQDDKQKCIDAGANDYIPKPVDVERLLSLMRVWLSGK